MNIKVFKSKRGKVYIKVIKDKDKDKDKDNYMMELNLDVMDLNIDMENKLILFVPKYKNGLKEEKDIYIIE